MKLLVVLSALVAFVAAAALTPTELDILDAFDYNSLVANAEQIQIYISDCLLEKGECGAYKQVADLAMQLMINECAECSHTQKAKYDCLLKQFHDEYEPLYNELMKKIAAKQEKSYD